MCVVYIRESTICEEKEHLLYLGRMLYLSQNCKAAYCDLNNN